AWVTNIENRAGSGIPDTHWADPRFRGDFWLELKFRRDPPGDAAAMGSGDGALRPRQAQWLEQAAIRGSRCGVLLHIRSLACYFLFPGRLARTYNKLSWGEFPSHCLALYRDLNPREIMEDLNR